MNGVIDDVEAKAFFQQEPPYLAGWQHEDAVAVSAGQDVLSVRADGKIHDLPVFVVRVSRGQADTIDAQHVTQQQRWFSFSP